MSELDIDTDVRNGEDSTGVQTRIAQALRLPFVAGVRLQPVVDLDGSRSVEIRAWAGVFFRVAQVPYRVSPDQPTLTWESTDDELIAAAVKILEQAEGVK